MKKFIAVFMCLFLVCAFPTIAFAEGEDSIVEGIVSEEGVDASTEENVAESEILGTEAVLDTQVPDTEAIIGTEMPGKSEAQIEAELTTEQIVSYVQSHLEEISVIITMVLTVFYQVRKHSALNKSVATLNNNSIAITENSNTAIHQALLGMEGVSSTVANYKNEMATLLAEVRQNAEEKKRLESALTEVESYLKTAKLANVELANEVAELLVLANIPNSKKEELYSRHRAAVDAITATETEVKKDDRDEA